MSWEKIHVSDFGWLGKLRAVQSGVVVDISSYTTRQFIFRKPNGTIVTKAALFSDDGTDGYLQYTVEDGVIDAAGEWQVQMRIAKAAAELTSDAHTFLVQERLDS